MITHLTTDNFIPTLKGFKSSFPGWPCLELWTSRARYRLRNFVRTLSLSTPASASILEYAQTVTAPTVCEHMRKIGRAYFGDHIFLRVFAQRCVVLSIVVQEGLKIVKHVLISINSERLVCYVSLPANLELGANDRGRSCPII